MSVHIIRCPWTKVLIKIEHKTAEEVLDRRLFKSKSQAGRELDIVATCVSAFSELIHLIDEFGISKKVKPEAYIHWLCEEVLEVNPHLRELIAGSKCDLQPHPEAKDKLAELCELQERTNELLLRLIERLDQPLNCYVKEG